MSTEQQTMANDRTWIIGDDIRKAKIKGKIVLYHVCSQLRFNIAFDENVFEYIGEGVIHSINGVIQSNYKSYHFWKLKT